MSSASPITPNWNSLPNEMKMMVIEHLENNSRLVLRSCSKSDLKLVDSVPFRTIHNINLWGRNNEWTIEIQEKEKRFVERLHFESFVDIQAKLLDVLEKIDFIKELFIDLSDSPEVLKLTTKSKQMKVKQLTISMVDKLSVLSQIDPSALKFLSFQSGETNAKVYDTPQVLQAEGLGIRNGCIRDDQLMKLAARKVWFTSAGQITNSGICAYIRKCAVDPTFDYFSIFSFNQEQCDNVIKTFNLVHCPSTNKYVSNTVFPSFQLEVNKVEKIVNGKRIKVNNDNFFTVGFASQLKKIQEMRISVNGDQYSFSVKNEDVLEDLFFDSSDDLQKKLSETLEKVNYIKTLWVYIMDHTCEWNLTTKKRKYCNVGKLNVTTSREEDTVLISELLKQIEPGHLKHIELQGRTNDRIIFGLPQVIQADYVKVVDLEIDDSQLLELSCEILKLGITNSYVTAGCEVTSFGLNAFIKKFLVSLDQKAWDFEITLDSALDHSELLEGLDIVSEKTSLQNTKVIVSSMFPNLQFKLNLHEKQIMGRRIRK